MSEEARYYRVGLFVLTGIVLLVGAVLLLGGTDAFRKTLTFETYFTESVQGLEVGSAVRLRGVKIGTVRDIQLAGDAYEEQAGRRMTDDDRIAVVVTINYTADSADAQAACGLEAPAGAVLAVRSLDRPRGSGTACPALDDADRWAGSRRRR